MAVIDLNSVWKHCSSFLLLEERSLRHFFKGFIGVSCLFKNLIRTDYNPLLFRGLLALYKFNVEPHHNNVKDMIQVVEGFRTS